MKIAGHVVNLKAIRSIKPGDIVFVCAEGLELDIIDELQDRLIEKLPQGMDIGLTAANFKIDVKMMDIEGLETLIEAAQHQLIIAQRGLALEKRNSLKRSGRLPSKAALIRKT